MLVLQSLFLLQRGNWQTVQAVITGQKDLHNKCIMKNDDPNYAFPDCAVEPLLNFHHHHQQQQHHHHDDHDHHCHHHSRGRTFYHCFLFGSSHLSWLSHFGLVRKSITSQVFWSCLMPPGSIKTLNLKTPSTRISMDQSSLPPEENHPGFNQSDQLLTFHGRWSSVSFVSAMAMKEPRSPALALSGD